MNTSIYVDQIPISFFLKKKEKKRENTENIKDKSSLCLYDEQCKTKIRISQKIQKIENYEKYFEIPEKVERVSITQNQVQPISLQSHILLYFKNKTNTSFTNFLFKKPTKQYIFHLLESYQILLKSLKKLQEQHICYFGISSQSIVFDIDTTNTTDTIPILQNFDSSFITTDATLTKKITHTIQNLQNFSFQPLEVHALYFLLINQLETLSYSQIEEIGSHYVKSMSVLSLFTNTQREKYKETCVEVLKKYVNQPCNSIIEDIIDQGSFTWDQYALNVLYLYLVDKTINQFSLVNTFLNGLFEYLIQQLDPDPKKRETLEQTLEKLEKLYEQYPSWLFVKGLN
jgi:hypothetical protein